MNVSLSQWVDFELYVMELAKECETADDYRDMSDNLHEHVETAIQELCHDNGIDDYDPCY